MGKSLEKIIIGNKTYDVIIDRKFMKNAYFRYKNGIFNVSCPYIMTTKTVLKNVEKFSAKLIKPEKINLENKYIMIFGEKQIAENQIFEVLGRRMLVVSEEDFYKQVKPLFLKYVTELVEKYEEIMKIPVKYKVRVQQMKTRLGSNSKKTMTLNFALGLIHYSKEAIESVVVHELAHYFYFDHSSKFYSVVYKYCPNYGKIQSEFRN